MAKLLQTTVTGSLNISGSSLLMPLLTGSTDVTSGSAGQLWINNEGSLNLKFTQVGSYGSQNSPFSCLGAFSAGGNLIAAKSMVGGIGASQNASLMVGGWPGPVTYHYDGASWSSGGSLITTASPNDQVAGVENAGIRAGGYIASDPGTNSTEEYNGSTWASGGNLIQARYSGGGAGFQNSMILVGGDGNPSSPYIRDCVEEYNGSSWSAGTAYHRQDRGLGVTGTQTAALAWGGYGPGTIVCTAYNYDGNAWSQTTTALRPVGFGQFLGSANSALSSTGYFSPSVRDCPGTQEWNGTTWSIGCNMIQGRRQAAGSGTTVSGLFTGGKCGTPSSTDLSLTEEYTKNLLQPFTYNAGASTDSWFGGPNMILGRNSNMAAGTPSAGITFGGQCAGGSVRVTCTEEFDGSAFTAGGALINANGAGGSAGTQNATLMAGGLVPPAYKNITEEYDGSSWSAGNAIITTRGYIAAWGGTQNAAYIAGGYPAFTCTEEYDGTNWATSNALSAATYLATGGGTQNAGIIAGGTQPGSSAYRDASYHYNGSTWSAGGTMSTARGYTLGGGLQDDFTVGGGLTPSYVSNTERYNGVSWCTVTPQPYNTYLNQSAPQSGGSNMLAFGGYTPSPAAGFSAQTLFYCETTDIDSSIPYCLGVWNAAANMITARGFSAQGGTSNAAFVAGGYQPSSPNRVACNEEFNGTAFSAGGALIQARSSNAGGGTQNAGIVFAGTPDGSAGLACTEEYDGSSFTAGGNMILGRHGGAGGGTQNAGIYTMGYSPPASRDLTEHYNGSSWSSANAINNIRSDTSFAGTQNSAIVMGGLPGPKSCVEEYNGTTWSNANAMPTARSGPNLSGTTNDAIMAGGGESATSDAFEWNGVSFNKVNSINVARFYGAVGSQGTSTSHLFMGGRTPTYLANTEEWSCTPANIGVWTAGPNMGTTRGYLAGVGTSNEFLAFGGQTPSYVTCSEEYNNIVWSATGALTTTRGFHARAGSVNAALAIFGQNPSNPQMNSTDEWNGATWSAGGSGITARRYPGGAGTQDAALAFVGNAPSAVSCTEEYNGTAWTAGGATIVAQYGPGGNGTQNAALKYGGSSDTDNTEAYNGSSWSAQANLITGRLSLGGGAGTQNDALAFSGYTPAVVSSTENFNGVAWKHINNQPNAAFYAANDGTSTSVLRAGGLTPSLVGNTDFLDFGNYANCGLYCFTKNLAPGNTDSSGTSYSSGY